MKFTTAAAFVLAAFSPLISRPADAGTVLPEAPAARSNASVDAVWNNWARILKARHPKVRYFSQFYCMSSARVEDTDLFYVFRTDLYPFSSGGKSDSVSFNGRQHRFKDNDFYVYERFATASQIEDLIRRSIVQYGQPLYSGLDDYKLDWYLRPEKAYKSDFAKYTLNAKSTRCMGVLKNEVNLINEIFTYYFDDGISKHLHFAPHREKDTETISEIMHEALGDAIKNRIFVLPNAISEFVMGNGLPDSLKQYYRDSRDARQAEMKRETSPEGFSAHYEGEREMAHTLCSRNNDLEGLSLSELRACLGKVGLGGLTESSPAARMATSPQSEPASLATVRPTADTAEKPVARAGGRPPAPSPVVMPVSGLSEAELARQRKADEARLATEKQRAAEAASQQKVNQIYLDTKRKAAAQLTEEKRQREAYARKVATYEAQKRKAEQSRLAYEQKRREWEAQIAGQKNAVQDEIARKQALQSQFLSQMAGTRFGSPWVDAAPYCTLGAQTISRAWQKRRAAVIAAMPPGPEQASALDAEDSLRSRWYRDRHSACDTSSSSKGTEN